MTVVRRKNTFKYYNKFFYCGDLTMEDYLLYMDDPLGTLKKILLEFNKEIPKLNVKQEKAFMDILFGRYEEEEEGNALDRLEEARKKKPVTEKQIEAFKKRMEDFHITVARMMIWLQQPYSEILKMPYSFFNDLILDMNVINGKEEYDVNRRSKRVDSGKLRSIKSQFGL